MLFLVLFLMSCLAFSQNYTSYIMGNPLDTLTIPKGGICLMGGATEDDRAMKWFLERANGGDVLVLRASGADGYNNYFFNELGIPIHSVETIVFHDSTASYEPYIIQRILQAEAIWIAGGNQWNYVHYWRNTPIDSAINQVILQKNIVIGGTSAGMAILGKFYFTAQNGTVSSSTALSDPYHPSITIDSTTFITNSYLHNVITDTHFDNPDRKGRLITFLARILADYGISAKAIACDEYTAVCIDTQGVAKVFGSYPAYDDNAYFVQVNCELPIQTPESCFANTPLTWYRNAHALKVCQLKGDTLGSQTFDLKDWKTHHGGNWFHWFVQNGILTETLANAPNCSTITANQSPSPLIFHIFPNPVHNQLNVTSPTSLAKNLHFKITDPLGRAFSLPYLVYSNGWKIDLNSLGMGVYFLQIFDETQILQVSKIIKKE